MQRLPFKDGSFKEKESPTDRTKSIGSERQPFELRFDDGIWGRKPTSNESVPRTEYEHMIRSIQFLEVSLLCGWVWTQGTRVCPFPTPTATVCLLTVGRMEGRSVCMCSVQSTSCVSPLALAILDRLLRARMVVEQTGLQNQKCTHSASQ